MATPNDGTEDARMIPATHSQTAHSQATDDQASDRSAAHRDLAERIVRSLDEVAGRAADRVCSQVPGYRQSADPGLRDDVAEHCLRVFTTFATSLAEDSDPPPRAFRTTAVHAMRRVTQSISLADFLQAFRISQLTLWESILELSAADESLRAAATDCVRLLMQVIESGSTTAAENYLEAQQYLLADRARATRDLVEDLLAGRLPGVGARQVALREAGLLPESSVVVSVATAVDDPDRRSPILRALAQAGSARPRGLVTVRHDEIIGIFAVPAETGSADLLDELRRVLDSLGNHGIELSVGASTVHAGLGAVPKAYREARLALRAANEHLGVFPLDGFSSFDYLVTQPDETAIRLIPERVRRFIEADLESGAVYIDTLEAYVRANLNARAAAEELYVHSNTAYYRLDRIAERTGRDLRDFGEVLDLLVAVRLLAPARRPLPGTFRTDRTAG